MYYISIFDKIKYKVRKVYQMNEITRYKNELNTVPMRQWSSTEQNIFFSILTAFRDKGTQEIIFNSSQIKEMAEVSREQKGTYFIGLMKGVVKKVAGMVYFEETSKSFEAMTLFSSFKFSWSDDLEEYTLEVAVSPKFQYILNQLEENYTQFKIDEFIAIKSSYAKTLFRYIKQWRTVGHMGGFPDGEIPKDKLFEMLAVPKSVQSSGNFQKRVIKPIIEELSPFFDGLKIKPIKARKAGNPIIAYKVSWKQEHTGTYDPRKFDNDKKKKPTAGHAVPEWSSKPVDKATPEEIEVFEAYKEQRRKEHKGKNES